MTLYKQINICFELLDAFASRLDGFTFHIQNDNFLKVFKKFLPYFVNKSPIKGSNYTNIVIYPRAHRICGPNQYFMVLWDVLYNRKSVILLPPLDFWTPDFVENGSYKFSPVRPFVRPFVRLWRTFLGICSLLFSETWQVVRGRWKLKSDGAGFFQKIRIFIL